jgi:hypothetical protein
VWWKVEHRQGVSTSILVSAIEMTEAAIIRRDQSDRDAFQLELTGAKLFRNEGFAPSRISCQEGSYPILI